MDFDALARTAAQDLGVLAQALLALALGGAIGLEREAAGKGAGLRTNMLVCLGSFLFVEVGLYITAYFSTAFPDIEVVPDPIRVVQAVAVGISFIGAGIIFRDPEQSRMRGHTTAATLLAVAPIGVAVALERYVLAVGVTVLMVLVLRLVNKLEARFFPAAREDA